MAKATQFFRATETYSTANQFIKFYSAIFPDPRIPHISHAVCHAKFPWLCFSHIFLFLSNSFWTVFPESFLSINMFTVFSVLPRSAVFTVALIRNFYLLLYLYACSKIGAIENSIENLCSLMYFYCIHWFHFFLVFHLVPFLLSFSIYLSI